MTLKQGLFTKLCISITCCKTPYFNISLMSLELLRETARLCLEILQSLWNMTGMASQHCCWATCQISKRLEYSKYQSHAFCYWLKINSIMSHYEIDGSLSFLTTSVYMDHPNVNGPPSNPAWMVRWVTQDFRLWTALIQLECTEPDGHPY